MPDQTEDQDHGEIQTYLTESVQRTQPVNPGMPGLSGFTWLVTVEGRHINRGGITPGAPHGPVMRAVYLVAHIPVPQATLEARKIALRAAWRDGFHPDERITHVVSVALGPVIAQTAIPDVPDLANLPDPSSLAGLDRA